MKLYIGCKLLEAEPMTRGERCDSRGLKVSEGLDAATPGYHVRYLPKGYESWTPERGIRNRVSLCR